jgi:hypothetical protein
MGDLDWNYIYRKDELNQTYSQSVHASTSFWEVTKEDQYSKTTYIQLNLALPFFFSRKRIPLQYYWGQYGDKYAVHLRLLGHMAVVRIISLLKYLSTHFFTYQDSSL